MRKNTRSLNLMAYLKMNDVDLEVQMVDGKLSAEYESTEEVEDIKRKYREEEWLHAYLRQFSRLREEATEQVEY